MALTFEPRPRQPKASPTAWAWEVRDGVTGAVIGGVEWLDRLGVYGFGAAPGGTAVFSDPAVMQDVGRFLEQVNR